MYQNKCKQENRVNCSALTRPGADLRALALGVLCPCCAGTVLNSSECSRVAVCSFRSPPEAPCERSRLLRGRTVSAFGRISLLQLPHPETFDNIPFIPLFLLRSQLFLLSASVPYCLAVGLCVWLFLTSPFCLQICYHWDDT